MKLAIPFALSVLALAAPLAALADDQPIHTGIYLTNDDLGRGGASYASSNTITIYSGGGATESDNGLGLYHVTQTPTALGALSGTLATYNDDGALGTNKGTASASADMATSTLGGTVTGNQRGLTTSLINDMLTFHVANGGSAEVGFNMQLDGSTSAEGQKSTELGLYFDFSYAILSQYISSDGTVDPGYAASLGDVSNLQSSFTGNGSLGATGDYLVTDGDTRRLQFALYLDCSGSAVSCDFNNGGHLVLDLPDGVTVTSSSGVEYGSSAVSAVPEPANMALMLAGIAGIAGIALRRRQADARSPMALG